MFCIVYLGDVVFSVSQGAAALKYILLSTGVTFGASTRHLYENVPSVYIEEGCINVDISSEYLSLCFKFS